MPLSLSLVLLFNWNISIVPAFCNSQSVSARTRSVELKILIDGEGDLKLNAKLDRAKFGNTFIGSGEFWPPWWQWLQCAHHHSCRSGRLRTDGSINWIERVTAGRVSRRVSRLLTTSTASSAHLRSPGPRSICISITDKSPQSTLFPFIQQTRI